MTLTAAMTAANASFACSESLSLEQAAAAKILAYVKTT